jgi:hypothetical protein
LFNELILDIAAIFLRRLSGESGTCGDSLLSLGEAGELLLLLLFLLYGRLPLDELDFGPAFGLFLAACGDNVGLLFGLFLAACGDNVGLLFGLLLATR